MKILLLHVLTLAFSLYIPPSAKVYFYPTKKLIHSIVGDRVIKFMALVLCMTFTCSNHRLHPSQQWLIELLKVFHRDLSPPFFCVFFPIFDNDLSTSNKCHFQTNRARATGLRSYKRSFNVVSGSHKIFYIISS